MLHQGAGRRRRPTSLLSPSIIPSPSSPPPHLRVDDSTESSGPAYCAYRCTFSTAVCLGVKGMGSSGIVKRSVRVTRSSPPPRLEPAPPPLLPSSAAAVASAHSEHVRSKCLRERCMAASEKPADSERQCSWNSARGWER